MHGHAFHAGAQEQFVAFPDFWDIAVRELRVVSNGEDLETLCYEFCGELPELFVVCGWEKTEKGCTYAITIPSNCKAEILLPNGESHSVEAGKYTYSI